MRALIYIYIYTHTHTHTHTAAVISRRDVNQIGCRERWLAWQSYDGRGFRGEKLTSRNGVGISLTNALHRVLFYPQQRQTEWIGRKIWILYGNSFSYGLLVCRAARPPIQFRCLRSPCYNMKFVNLSVLPTGFLMSQNITVVIFNVRGWFCNAVKKWLDELGSRKIQYDISGAEPVAFLV